MADTTTFAPFFSVKKAKPGVPRYRATWPCGSHWEFDRYDLSVPIFEFGKQSGVSIETDSVSEMFAELASEGAIVTRIDGKPATRIIKRR